MPGSESFLKVALLEEPPFQDLTKTFNEQYGKVKATFGSVSDTVGSLSDTVSGFFGAKKGPEVQPTESKDKKPKKEVSEASPVKEVASPPAKSETKTAAKSDAAAPPPSTPDKPKAPALPRDIVELEREIELSAQLAIKQYNAAIAVIKKCVNISKNPIYVYSIINPHAGSMTMCAMWWTRRSSMARTPSGEH